MKMVDREIIMIGIGIVAFAAGFRHSLKKYKEKKKQKEETKNV